MEDENKVYVVDKLEEALLEKYERLKFILDSEPDASDEYKNAEREVNILIDKMQAFHKTNCEYFAKEEERDIEKRKNEDMAELEDQKLKAHSETERERNEMTLKLEQEKQKLTWKRIAFEFGKIVVPIIGGAIVYSKAQNKVLKFEETGRITSTAGRELHLPKIFK